MAIHIEAPLWFDDKIRAGKVRKKGAVFYELLYVARRDKLWVPQDESMEASAFRLAGRLDDLVAWLTTEGRVSPDTTEVTVRPSEAVLAVFRHHFVSRNHYLLVVTHSEPLAERPHHLHEVELQIQDVLEFTTAEEARAEMNPRLWSGLDVWLLEPSPVPEQIGTPIDFDRMSDGRPRLVDRWSDYQAMSFFDDRSTRYSDTCVLPVANGERVILHRADLETAATSVRLTDAFGNQLEDFGDLTDELSDVVAELMMGSVDRARLISSSHDRRRKGTAGEGE